MPIYQLLLGGAALIAGSVAVKGVFLKTDVFYAFLAGALPMILLVDKSLSRLDGIILLAVYIFYQLIVFNEKYKKVKTNGEEGFIRRLLRKLNHKNTQKEIGWIFLGIALLLFASDMLVRVANQTALILGVPVLIVGLIMVAVGTSLPELAFSIKAIKQQQPEMVFGSLLGSVVTNATLVIGLVSLISPIRVSAFSQYLLATMVFVVVFLAFYFFVRTKHRLERWEGAFLILFYLVFVLVGFAF